MKKVLSLFLVLVFALSLISIPVYAQTYTDKVIISLSKKNVTVGSEVTVTIRQTASYSMVSIQGALQYNSSVLQFVSGESGNTSNSGSTVNIVKDSAPTSSISVSVKFKAIAAGSGSLSYSGKSFSEVDDGKGAAGTAVTVTELKPSTDNNLGSLRISKGTLTPAFRAGTLNYTATVKYDVTNVTISANAAAGDAKVAGVGTFDLDVGNNTRGVTVTAASGDKKTYTVKIKRLSEEETAEQEKEERDNNPLLFDYNGEDRLIAPDITNLADFEGYEKAELKIKNEKIGYLKDKAGKYNLFWATDEKGLGGTFYNRDAEGNYTKVNYLQTKGRIYIVEPFEEGINVSSQFVLSEQEVNGDTIECYRYGDEEFKDFCVLYCYLNGESDYYRFDASQNTVQREPMFLSTETVDVATQPEEPQGSILDKFNQLGKQAQIIILLLCFAGLLIFVLIILLIIKAASGKGAESQYDYDPADDEEEDEDDDDGEDGGLSAPVAKELPFIGTAQPDLAENIDSEIESFEEPAEEEPAEEVKTPADDTDTAGDASAAADDTDDSGIDTSEFIDMDDDF